MDKRCPPVSPTGSQCVEPTLTDGEEGKRRSWKGSGKWGVGSHAALEGQWGWGTGRAGQTSQGKGRRVSLGFSLLAGSVWGEPGAGSLGLVPCVGSSEQRLLRILFPGGPTLQGSLLPLRLRAAQRGERGESRPRPRVTPSLNGGANMDLQPSRRRGAGPLLLVPDHAPWTGVLPGAGSLATPDDCPPPRPTPCRAEEGRCDNWPGFLNLEKEAQRRQRP